MILATGFEECIEDRLAPAARGRKAGIGLVNAPRHSIKIDLRPTLGAVQVRESLKSNPAVLQHRQGRTFVGIVRAGHAESPTPEEELQGLSLLVLLP
jgi:hypothetical protein